MHVRSTDYRSTRRGRQRCSSSSPVVHYSYLPSLKTQKHRGGQTLPHSKEKEFQNSEFRVQRDVVSSGRARDSSHLFRDGRCSTAPFQSPCCSYILYRRKHHSSPTPPHPSPLILLFLLGFCLVPLYTYSMIIRIWNHNLIFVLRRDAARLLAGVGFKKALPPQGFRLRRRVLCSAYACP